MKKIVFAVIIILVAFSIYKGQKMKSSDELLKEEVEHQVEEAFKQLGDEMEFEVKPRDE
jgi:hypothetical protein